LSVQLPARAATRRALVIAMRKLRTALVIALAMAAFFTLVSPASFWVNLVFAI